MRSANGNNAASQVAERARLIPHQEDSAARDHTEPNGPDDQQGPKRLHAQLTDQSRNRVLYNCMPPSAWLANDAATANGQTSGRHDGADPINVLTGNVAPHSVLAIRSYRGKRLYAGTRRGSGP